MGGAPGPVLLPEAPGEAPEPAGLDPRVEDPQPPVARKPTSTAASRPDLTRLACPRLSLLLSSPARSRPQLSYSTVMSCTPVPTDFSSPIVKPSCPPTGSEGAVRWPVFPPLPSKWTELAF